MAAAPRTRKITPMIRLCLKSFGRARAAIVAGKVDEMIGQLTQGVALLEAIDRCEVPGARRRPARKSAS